MHGSVAISQGVLWVGCHASTAHVRAFDLDGRPLARGFSFRDSRARRSAVAGLAVDRDHRLWVADTPGSRLRVFTIFGTELASFGADETDPAGDEPERLTSPTGVGLVEGEGDPWIVVASQGRRRHAARILEQDGSLVASLRPMGDSQGLFRGVRGVAARGRFAYVCEWGAGRIQVFRDLDFHFAFGGRERDFRPAAARPLSDGRVIVASTGEASRLVLFDGAGSQLGIVAGPGAEEGEVSDPDDLAVIEGRDDRHTRVFVLDRDGERVQVFNLEGRCFGAFESLAV